MRLDRDDCRGRLAGHDHAILCTAHHERGVDAVPVVFAVDDADHVGIPVDRVKPKASQRLQRERNLDADPRATLLVEHWDRADWSQLWWVRAELEHVADPAAELVEDLSNRLRDRYRQYDRDSFTTVLVLRLGALNGWAATSS
ncbi:pyridoxamine 5'-phosphate oxidase family protein [Ilumatobacter sp.]|uniref:pyridoxamine 5'-phosphate oxidase family protein n=1 Tax=Ilumatobacter sp. TaxID=1967498 RepID=UPI003B52D6FB